MLIFCVGRMLIRIIVTMMSINAQTRTPLMFSQNCSCFCAPLSSSIEPWSKDSVSINLKTSILQIRLCTSIQDSAVIFCQHGLPWCAYVCPYRNFGLFSVDEIGLVFLIGGEFLNLSTKRSSGVLFFFDDNLGKVRNMSQKTFDPAFALILVIKSTRQCPVAQLRHWLRSKCLRFHRYLPLWRF